MTAPIAVAAKHEVQKKAEKKAVKKSTEKAASSERADSSGGKPVKNAKGKQLIAFGADKTKDASKLFIGGGSRAPEQRPKKSVVTQRHILAFEFWIGIIAILTENSSLNKKNVGLPNQNQLVIEAGAFTLVFAVLFGITSGGQQAARVASALGGLTVLTIVMKQEFFRTKNGVPGRFTIFNSGTKDNGTTSNISDSNPFVNQAGQVSTPSTVNRKGME